MEKFVINGGKKLSGKINASVSKNAVLPIMCACLLTDEPVLIKNCPKIKDVYSMIEIFNHLGVFADFVSSGDAHGLLINSKNISCFDIPSELATKLRASSLALGALLSKCKQAILPYPGGCKIGDRPLDIHINALTKLGAKITEKNGVIYSKKEKEVDGVISLEYPSVGATENAIMFSVLGKNKVTIKNVAKEPEIKDLCDFLNYLGAKITLDKRGIIYIDGVEKLHGGEYQPISDRIETGTFLIASAITGGELEISGVKAENIFALLTKLCESTCKITINNDIIYIRSGNERKPFVIKTGPFPMFPTDLQAQICVLASISNGVSVIEENVFSSRYFHLAELRKMGANVTVKDSVAYFRGVSALKGASVTATDLRGGASLVLAGLVAEGQTEVYGVSHIDRGYENFEEKLRLLGADVYRQS